MAAPKRISKEFAALSGSPPEGIKIPDDLGDNMYEWKIVIEGPSDSPYAGGHFHVDLKLPPEYPFKPPVLKFTTKIYHPNVSNDSPPNDGNMCLGMLRPDQWKPPTKLEAVFEFARNMLREPNPDDPMEAKIAEQYKTDRGAYEKEAREWTKRYATGKK